VEEKEVSARARSIHDQLQNCEICSTGTVCGLRRAFFKKFGLPPAGAAAAARRPRDDAHGHWQSPTAATVQSVLSAEYCVQYRYTDAWTISLDYAAPMHGWGGGEAM
jgi:hypothetical protein